MGLLGKAIAKHNESGVQSLITGFHHNNSLFHAIVLQGRGAINDMIACHGAVAADLPGGNTLVLLPSALDRELFAHRISRSSGLTVLYQLSADSPAPVLETLSPWLQ